MSDHVRQDRLAHDPVRSHGGRAGNPGDLGSVCSILFADATDPAARPVDPRSALFRDLNLDQVIASVVKGREEYDLAPLFHTRLSDPHAIAYRHEVMRDLQHEPLRRTIARFANGMKRMRRCLSLSARRPYPYEKQVWSVHGARAYTDAVASLATELEETDLRSRGLAGFRAYLVDHAHADAFLRLADRTHRVLDELAAVRYCLRIEGSSITVTGCDDEEPDFSADVLRTFARFREGEGDSRAEQPAPSGGLGHVENAILERVARRYPRVFAGLQQAHEQQGAFLDGTVRAFDREVQFYLAYLDYLAPMRHAGLPFTYPHVSESKQVKAVQAFDIALAHGLAGGGGAVVRNDFSLSGPERVLVITGANQGGKTTFARMFGQLHYLAALGLPVPGCDVHLSRFDHLLTHFPEKERLEDLRGRLQDELLRVHRLLERATPHSIVILNELFDATKAGDATVLGAAILEQIERLDALCVFVTFLDELAAPVPERVSLVAEVDPDDPSVRTFRVVRQRARGRAHALAVAEKHGVTYDTLRERIRR